MNSDVQLGNAPTRENWYSCLPWTWENNLICDPLESLATLSNISSQFSPFPIRVRRWWRGYHVCFTRRRSRVQSPANVLFFCFFRVPRLARSRCFCPSFPFAFPFFLQKSRLERCSLRLAAAHGLHVVVRPGCRRPHDLQAWLLDRRALLQQASGCCAEMQCVCAWRAMLAPANSPGMNLVGLCHAVSRRTRAFWIC